MKFGIPLGLVNPSGWADVARAADECGFESIWLPEHLVLPVRTSGSPIAGAAHAGVPPDTKVFDVFTYLGYLAGITSRVHLGTNVYNIGLRHPFVVARAAATLDSLAPGRFEFGVGASWLREEWDAVGLDFATRGRRIDESLAVCRRLWGEAIVEHHGEFYDFDPVMFEPKPESRLRVHVGGDGPAALRRAATIGDGWIPMNHTVESLSASLARLRQIQSEAGNDRHIEVTMRAEVATDDDLVRLALAGVDRVLVRPFVSSRDAVSGMQRFADNFLVGQPDHVAP